MNKKTRKQLENLLCQIDELRNEIDFISDEELDKLNNTPDNLQGSEQYAKMETITDALSDCVSDLQSAFDNLENAINE